MTIPSSVSELNKGWCNATKYLKKVTVIQNGVENIKNFEEKFVIGKSDLKSDEFDVLVFASRELKSVTIPPFVKHIGSYAFSSSLITKISIPSHVETFCEGAFSGCNELCNIEISPDSELRRIEKNAFCGTKIESLFIPSKVCELEDGWCSETTSLNEVKIMLNNQHFKLIDDKLIIGKSDEKSDEFDVVVFACRDIENVTIPSNVKKIAPFAFSESSIEKVVIPPHVTHICEGAFLFCEMLQNVEIPANSELQIIEKEAFSDVSIESIFIPKHVKSIGEESFYSCKNLQHVIIPINSELQTIEKRAFIHSSITIFFIPKHIKTIYNDTFSWCDSLKKVEFSEDSEIETIEKRAFYSSMIETIIIPSSVRELKSGWCNELYQLTKFTIMPREIENIKNYNDTFIIGKSDIKSDIFDVLLFARRDLKTVEIPSFIKIIGPHSFSRSLLESITIPSHVTHICEYAFAHCMQLLKFEILPDSQLQIIGECALLETFIERIFVPPHVTDLPEGCLSWCKALKFVDYSSDSMLQTVGERAFYFSEIESLVIPASVSTLKKGWCKGVPKLKKVTVMPNNKHFKNFNEIFVVGKIDEKSDEFDSLAFVSRNIETVIIPPFIKQIEPYALSHSSVTNVTIPSQVTQICEGAFYICEKLQKIEFESDSMLQVIGKYAFYNTSLQSIHFPPRIAFFGEESFCVHQFINLMEIDENSQFHSIAKRKIEGCDNAFLMIPVNLRDHFKLK